MRFLHSDGKIPWDELIGPTWKRAVGSFCAWLEKNGYAHDKARQHLEHVTRTPQGVAEWVRTGRDQTWTSFAVYLPIKPAK